MKKILAPLVCLSLSTLCSADEAAIKTQFKVVQKITSTLKSTPSEDLDLNRAITVAEAMNTTFAQIINNGRYKDLESWTNQPPHKSLPSNYTEALAKLKLEIEKHLKETEAAEIVQLKNLEKRIKKEVIAAKEPEDLDTLLSDVSAISKGFNSSYSRNNKEIQSLQQTVSSAATIISQWQNYLIAESVKDSKSCKRSLESISSSLARTPIIPRSYVLRLLNPPPATLAENSEKESEAQNSFISFSQVETALNTGSPLTEILEMLDKIAPKERDLLDTKRFKSAVKQLLPHLEQPRSISFTELTSDLKKSSQTSTLLRSANFTKARNKVLIANLTKSYSNVISDLKKEFTSPENLLKAAFSYHLKNKDWVKASSVATDHYEYMKFVGVGDSISYRNDATALTSIARAESAVKAEELQLAIKNYRSAVGTTKNQEVFQAGFEGLKALKESHPKEFLQESEYAKANAAIKTEERLAHMSRYSSLRGRSSRENQLSPELQKLVAEMVKVELAKSRTEKLDKALETKE